MFLCAVSYYILYLLLRRILLSGGLTFPRLGILLGLVTGVVLIFVTVRFTLALLLLLLKLLKNLFQLILKLLGCTVMTVLIIFVGTAILAEKVYAVT